MTLEVDVTDREAVTKAVARVAEERGGLDWVVCSAGIVKDRVTWKMSQTEWDDVIRVNLTGGFNVARAATPSLWKSPRGRLVFIGSINEDAESSGRPTMLPQRRDWLGSLDPWHSSSGETT